MINCPLPYMHQFIGQNFTKPCCNFGIDSSKTPKEYWHSSELATVRSELESGVWPIGCRTCEAQEKNNQLSLRQRSLQEHSMPNEPLVEYVDVRLSNKCNFACRTCEPQFSSRIAKESQVHDLHKYYGYSLDNNYVEHSQQISEDIKQILPNIKKLMFTGGEPTYIEQFYDILQVCNSDTNLLVTTNASMISDRFLSSVQKFDNLHITLSIDAVGEHAEYIRYGTDWSIVDANIQKILGLNCSVMYNTVLSAYSVPYLESLVDYIITHEQDNYGADMYICTYPEHLHPCVLPVESRDNLISSLKSCILKLSASSRSEDYTNAIKTLDDLITMLKTEQRPDSKFLAFTKQLDTIRNQKYKELI